jgi:hypothetical protein
MLLLRDGADHEISLARSARLVMPCSDRSAIHGRSSRSADRTPISSLDRSSSTGGSISRPLRSRRRDAPCGATARLAPQPKPLPRLGTGGIRSRMGPSRPSRSTRAPKAACARPPVQSHVQVVAHAGEHRMGVHANLDAQVPCGATAKAHRPSAAHEPCPRRTRWPGCDGQTLRAHRLPGTLARLARTRPLLPCAAARTAASREHHVSADGPDGTRALAHRTRRRRRRGHPTPGAGPAYLLTTHRDRLLRAGKASAKDKRTSWCRRFPLSSERVGLRARAAPRQTSLRSWPNSPRPVRRNRTLELALPRRRFLGSHCPSRSAAAARGR